MCTTFNSFGPTRQTAANLASTFGCVRKGNETLARRHQRWHGKHLSTNVSEANAHLTVTVSRDPDGRWYISLMVDVPDPDQATAPGAVVGVDLGLKDFAVTSDGVRIPHPKTLAKRERNLARYRMMARKELGSANRAKARAKVARAHRKVRASRTDFLRKTSTELVRDHDVIVIEDLAVKNLVRNRSLAKAIADSGWGAFRRLLEDKTTKTGTHLVVVDR